MLTITNRFLRNKLSLQISLNSVFETRLKIDHIIGHKENHNKFLSKLWWLWDHVSHGSGQLVKHASIRFSSFISPAPLSYSLDFILNKPSAHKPSFWLCFSFLTHGWLNLRMQNPWTGRAECCIIRHLSYCWLRMPPLSRIIYQVRLRGNSVSWRPHFHFSHIAAESWVGEQVKIFAS